jgi:hypothetical protein
MFKKSFFKGNKDLCTAMCIRTDAQRHAVYDKIKFECLRATSTSTKPNMIKINNIYLYLTGERQTGPGDGKEETPPHIGTGHKGPGKPSRRPVVLRAPEAASYPERAARLQDDCPGQVEEKTSNLTCFNTSKSGERRRGGSEGEVKEMRRKEEKNDCNYSSSFF